MAIRRISNLDDYTVIPTYALNDKRLHWRDIGLLVYLMSRPPYWRVSVANLVDEGNCGRDAIRDALNRLINAGYVVADEVRAENGQHAAINYVVAQSLRKHGR